MSEFERLENYILKKELEMEDLRIQKNEIHRKLELVYKDIQESKQLLKQ